MCISDEIKLLLILFMRLIRVIDDIFNFPPNVFNLMETVVIFLKLNMSTMLFLFVVHLYPLFFIFSLFHKIIIHLREITVM